MEDFGRADVWLKETHNVRAFAFSQYLLQFVQSGKHWNHILVVSRLRTVEAGFVHPRGEIALHPFTN